jgi:hypothetical protein
MLRYSNLNMVLPEYSIDRKPVNKFQIFDNEVHEIKTVVVHKITMGDVEDPDLYVAEPIYKWQQTEEGQWVMANSVEQPMWNRYMDHTTFGHVYSIVAYLKARDYTFWALKWGKV